MGILIPISEQSGRTASRLTHGLICAPELCYNAQMNEQVAEAEATTSTPIQPEPSEGGFAKTSKAAKLSGKIHGTAGFFKQKFGEFTDDIDLKENGRNQRLLGKVHVLVGELREIRELATKRTLEYKDDGAKILQKHAGKLIDQATEFLGDIKKTFLR